MNGCFEDRLPASIAIFPGNDTRQAVEATPYFGLEFTRDIDVNPRLFALRKSGSIDGQSARAEVITKYAVQKIGRFFVDAAGTAPLPFLAGEVVRELSKRQGESKVQWCKNAFHDRLMAGETASLIPVFYARSKLDDQTNARKFTEVDGWHFWGLENSHDYQRSSQYCGMNDLKRPHSILTECAEGRYAVRAALVKVHS